MARRWDTDERERGIADARRLVPGARELAEAFDVPDWVAEEPEAHLRPHIEAWCERDDRLALAAATIDELGAYVLQLAWHGPPRRVGEARAAIFSLIGEVAESATYVRQRRVDSDGTSRLRFEVGTGELDDAAFAPHGHVLIIDVTGVL